MTKLPKGQFVWLSIKLQFEDGQYRSLLNVIKVELISLERTLSYYIKGLELNSEDYNTTPLTQLIISYIYIYDKHNKIKKEKLQLNRKQIPVPSMKFAGYNLPNTTNISKWGEVISKKGNTTMIQKFNSNLVYSVIRHINYNIITIFSGTDIILTFKDIKGVNPNTFVREVKNSKYTFINSELILKELKRKTNFLKTITEDKKIKFRFPNFGY